MNLVYRSDWHERRKNAIENEAAICAAYASGLSAAQTAKQFGVSGRTVFNILERTGQAARPSGEGVSLRWKDAAYTAHQVAMRIGKTPGNKGMTYTIGRPISKPNLLGEKNPGWKGGRLTWVNRVRRSGQYQFWRRSVFERDNYACVQCSKRGGRLEADHIRAFSGVLDDHGITSLDEAIACTALWDVNNGRTLCCACHRKTSTFGAKSAKNRDLEKGAGLARNVVVCMTEM